MSKYKQLARWERNTIAYFRHKRMSHTEIARVLERSPSTICREVQRNHHVSDGAYRAEVA